jgi:hypothetical protein
MISRQERNTVKALTSHPGWAIVKRELQIAILRVVREQGEVLTTKTIERKGGESSGLMKALDLLGSLESESTDTEAD